MTVVDEIVAANGGYAAAFAQGVLPMPPSRRVAVVACMDARLDVYRLAGLELGEAHVIRNAGGVISDDVVRSLVISQRLLGTDHIVLIHHTDCGMLTFEDDPVKDQITAETGIRPTFALEAFKDPVADVRQSIARIEASPFIPHKNVRGFVFDVKIGQLQEVA